MFCPNCGTKLEDGVKFCPNCGNQISQNDSSLDVLIDSFGAIIFLIICYMIASFANKR